MTTKQVKRKVKSCWEGATRSTLASPLGELTYVGLIPTTFRTQLVDIGLSQKQIERIGKDTAMHALKVTYKLMWKQRTDRSHDYAGENTQRIPTKSRNDTRGGPGADTDECKHGHRRSEQATHGGCRSCRKRKSTNNAGDEEIQPWPTERNGTIGRATRSHGYRST